MPRVLIVSYWFPPYSGIGGGCPNRWVLRAGSDGKTVTGFQTQNLGDIRTPAQVEAALKNAWVNSDGVFVELYEGPLWIASATNDGVLPGKTTLLSWFANFAERRRKTFASLGDPYPKTYRHTFDRASPGSLYYFDPSMCRVSGGPYGTIIVDK